MPAARLRNALARGLWQAGCWLQLAARRLEVAGPATAPSEPVAQDAWQPGRPGHFHPADPPPHWQRLLDGRDPRQLRAVPRPAGGDHDAAPMYAGRDAGHVPTGGEPLRAHGDRRSPEPSADADVVTRAHSTPVARPPVPAVRRQPDSAARPHLPRDWARDDSPTRDPSTPPAPSTVAGRPHGPGAIGRTDWYGHTIQHNRPATDQSRGGGPGRWPTLPDDTPLWALDWPDPVRERAARLDEEQRGTPWSG